MDNRQLRYFLAVVEYGSVTRAAGALYLAQPALTQSLKALEAELGVDLFVREPRGMRLSRAGEELLGPAQRVRDATNTAIDSVERVVSLASGRLDVAAPADLAVDPLAPIVSRFRLLYPGVTVDISSSEPDRRVVDLLRTARCEVGFEYLPVDDARVDAIPLGRRRHLLGLPNGALPGASTVVGFAELAGVPLVLGHRGSVLRSSVEHLASLHGFVPDVAVTVDQEYGVFRLVAAGAGAAFLTPGEAKRATQHNIRIVRTEPEIGIDIGLISRRDRLSPAASAFVELSRHHPVDITQT